LDLLSSQLPLQSDNRHTRKYVLRFAAGFGSQFAYVLYRKWDENAGLAETDSGDASGFNSESTTPHSFTAATRSESHSSLSSYGRFQPHL